MRWHPSCGGDAQEIPEHCGSAGPMRLLQLDEAKRGGFVLRSFVLSSPHLRGTKQGGLRPGLCAITRSARCQCHAELRAPAPLKAGLGDPPNPKSPFALLWFTLTLPMPAGGWARGKAAGLPFRAALAWQPPGP